jgi:hypothetical protein
MDAYVLKTLKQLKPSEIARIDKHFNDMRDEELIIVQFTMIKEMACSLADMGMKPDEILQFIAGYQRFYRQNSRFKTQEELLAFLDKRLANIFGERGFPEEYLQSFREIGR